MSRTHTQPFQIGRLENLFGNVMRVVPFPSPPVLLTDVSASSGRGSDIKKSMAIPTFGGMMVVTIAIFVVPVLFCMFEEAKLAVSKLQASNRPESKKSSLVQRHQGVRVVPTLFAYYS